MQKSRPGVTPCGFMRDCRDIAKAILLQELRTALGVVKPLD